MCGTKLLPIFISLMIASDVHLKSPSVFSLSSAIRSRLLKCCAGCIVGRCSITIYLNLVKYGHWCGRIDHINTPSMNTPCMQLKISKKQRWHSWSVGRIFSIFSKRWRNLNCCGWQSYYTMLEKGLTAREAMTNVALKWHKPPWTA